MPFLNTKSSAPHGKLRVVTMPIWKYGQSGIFSHRCLQLCLGMLLMPASVNAEGTFTPNASSHIEYNSNVFSLSSEEQAATQNEGDTQRADTYTRYAIGADSKYTWGPQSIDANVAGSLSHYFHFDQLDHKEYSIDGGYSWKLFDTADGSLHYKQAESMTPFGDIGGTTLELQTQRTGDAMINLNLSPEWRVETGGDETQIKSPRIGAADYLSKDTSGRAALLYRGFSGITAGLNGQYDLNVIDDPGQTAEGETIEVDSLQSHQETMNLSVLYVIPSFSTLHSNLGFTRLTTDGVPQDSTSGFSGNIEYGRTLSGKSKINLNVYQRVAATTVANAQTAIDSGATLSLAWSPADKVDASATYTFEKDHYKSSADLTAPDRKDEFQDSRATIGYRFVKWLTLNSYLEYEDRQSTIDVDSYNALIVGLEVDASWK